MNRRVAFFIDGTGQKTAAPTKKSLAGSKYTYSGRNKMHCSRYQVVCDLFELIWDVSGHYGGSVHDKSMYDESRLGTKLENLYDYRGREFVIYGDSAYNNNDILCSQLIAASKHYPAKPLTPEQRLQNQEYIPFIIKIERTFGMIASLFKGINLWFKNKEDASSSSRTFKLACLFLNFYTIFKNTTNNRELRR